MGHKHTRDELLDAAVATALEDGLSQLSFGRVARRLGISDRVVVYYFPTKDDLVGEVVVAMGFQLQGALAEAFTEPAADHVALARAAWPVLASEGADAVLGMYFEAIGLAAAGREPYRSLVPALVEAWVAWAAEYVEGDDVERRRQAEAAIALLDGLLLLRQLVGPEPAQRAAEQLGIG